jgi:cellobiose-specific phosphotransferase system component IIB
MLNQNSNDWEEFERELEEDQARQMKEEYIRRQTTPIGNRLEDVVQEVLEELKRNGTIRDWEHPEEEGAPDFIVNGDIGIECKNWDPEKKTAWTKLNIKEKLLSKFAGRKWKKKILVTPEVKYYEKSKVECKKLIEDGDIEVIDSFPYVTESNKEKVKKALFPKLEKSLK